MDELSESRVCRAALCLRGESADEWSGRPDVGPGSAVVADAGSPVGSPNRSSKAAR